MTEKALKPIKPFLNYEEQIKNLIERKGMVITDRKFATSKLEDISYFALIDGYKNLFYNPMTRKYREGTTFEDIVALYEFDEKLRALIFQYLCHFEQKMRSLISYHFCDIYSERQEDYLDAAHYDNSGATKKKIAGLIAILDREAKMYSFLTTSMKTKISIHFEHVSEKELIQYMKVLTLYRNVCAHNERLFSYKSRYDIPDTVLHKKMKLPQNGNKYECGKNDLFSVVIAFRMLLSKDDFAEFKKSLNQIMNQYMKKTSNLSQDIFLKAMGFPENWKSISRYKL